MKWSQAMKRLTIKCLFPNSCRPNVGLFDRFQITFAFDQFRAGNQVKDVLAVGMNPTSYNFTSGPRSWKELQLSQLKSGEILIYLSFAPFAHRPEHAMSIINRACGERICLHTAVEAILEHIDYNSKMFEKE